MDAAMHRTGSRTDPGRLNALKGSELRKLQEKWIERLVTLNGLVAILALLLIFAFLVVLALPLFRHVSLRHFLAGRNWYPLSEIYGILPLILGSALVTAGAVVIAVPISVGFAVYLAELAPPRLREYLKPAVEILAGIPSVVLGFLGLVVLSPLIKDAFQLSTGLCALTGSIMLAFMAAPTIISISEDALAALPQELRHGSLALGATRLQTIWRVLVPAARSGIVAAVMLGVGRAIGETMAVMMVTGNSAVIPTGPLAILGPVRTMTATIAAEMGETVQNSPHYHSLFAIGLVLFLMTFVINLIADLSIRRSRR